MVRAGICGAVRFATVNQRRQFYCQIIHNHLPISMSSIYKETYPLVHKHPGSWEHTDQGRTSLPLDGTGNIRSGSTSPYGTLRTCSPAGDPGKCGDYEPFPEI